MLVALGIIVDTTTAYASWHLPTAIGAVSGLAYEAFRRRRRLAFVVHGREHVGVYRAKRLAGIARLDELVRYRLRALNTFRQLIAFGLAAVVGAAAWSRVICIQFVLQNAQLGSEVVVLRRRDATRLGLNVG